MKLFILLEVVATAVDGRLFGDDEVPSAQSPVA